MLPEDPAGCAAADGCILALELVAEATGGFGNGGVEAAHDLGSKRKEEQKMDVKTRKSQSRLHNRSNVGINVLAALVAHGRRPANWGVVWQGGRIDLIDLLAESTTVF